MLVAGRKVQYIVEFVICVVMIMCAALVHYVLPVQHVPFFLERDPSLSQPFTKESVSDNVLIVITIPVPVVIIVLWMFFCKFRLKLETKDWRTLDPINGVLSYLTAGALTLLITDVIKCYTGRFRPCFYAMCNYKGYRDALVTGNFSYYFSQTVPDLPGDMKYCLETNHEILREAQTGFPSAHASLSLCAFIYIGLILQNSLHEKTHRYNILKLCIIALLLWPAIFIALSRPREYLHDYSDTTFGAFLGLIVSVFTFYISFVYSRNHWLEKDEQTLIEQTGE
jgi:membrane-associated phospholipid phosphatase